MARDLHAALTLPSSSRASVTLVVLCLMTALGIALGSYLTLCTRSAQFSARTVSLDQVQQLAQTGLEEALWALNQSTWTTSGPSGSTTWTTAGADRTVTLTYPLSAPYTSGTVVLKVTSWASTSPTITSAATLTLQSGQTFTKTLQATTGLTPLFGNAIASSDSYVSFSDGGTIDSWYSGSGATATPYTFTPPGNATNYAAVIAGRSNGTKGVVLSQAQLKGYVATFGLDISYSSSATPAPKIVGPSTAAGINIDPTRVGKSAFVPTTSVFTVTPPTSFDYSNSLLDAVIDLVNSLNLLTISTSTTTVKKNGTFKINGSSILGFGYPSLTVNRPMRIVVDGDLQINGVGKITIMPTGSLELFVTGDVSIDGNGFDNQTNDPKKLAIYCTDTATTAIIYRAAVPFCGVLYSENKPIDIESDGPFYGALLSRNSITFGNSTTVPIFHYDTALRNVRFAGIKTPYIIKQQKEL